MILKIELENFFSIKEKVCVDFCAANIKTASSKALADNVMDWKGTKVLKSIGLFGQNASGKSNIIKAIKFCCAMVLESHLHNEGTIVVDCPDKIHSITNAPAPFAIYTKRP